MNRGERTVWVIFIIIIIGVIAFLSYMVFGTEDGVSWNVTRMVQDSDEKVYNKIEVAYEIADYDKSLDLISEFLVDYPASDYRTPVMVIAANILYENGNEEESKNYIAKVVSDFSADTEEFVKAVIILGKIMKDNATYDPVTLNYLEDAYLKATVAFRPELAVYLGYAYLYKGDYLTAINYFSSSVGDESIMGRAQVYIAQEKYSEAIQEFENFFSLYPTSPYYDFIKTSFLTYTYDYAESLKDNDAYDLSVEYFLKIVNRFKNEPFTDAALCEIADIYYINFAYDTALTFLDKALENSVDFSDDSAMFSKGLIYYETENKSGALAQFNDLIEQYPASIYLNQASEWKELIMLEMQF